MVVKAFSSLILSLLIMAPAFASDSIDVRMATNQFMAGDMDSADLLRKLGLLEMGLDNADELLTNFELFIKIVSESDQWTLEEKKSRINQLAREFHLRLHGNENATAMLSLIGVLGGMLYGYVSSDYFVGNVLLEVFGGGLFGGLLAGGTASILNSPGSYADHVNFQIAYARTLECQQLLTAELAAE